MSFILDALRKSDAERQRAATPGLADVRYSGHRSRRSVWIPLLVLVLALNVGVMAFNWLRPGPRPAPVPPPSAPAASSAPGAAASAPGAIPPGAEIRPLAREAESGEPVPPPEGEAYFEPGMARGPQPAPVVFEAAEPAPAGAGAPAAAAVAPVSPPAVPVASATPAPPGAATPKPAPEQAPAHLSRIVPGNELPTAEQLIGAGTLDIPMLNLDLHVYSGSPASRFVVINSRKYKEGATLTEGPVVESITADGVILSSGGHRFTLSRR